MAHEIVHEGYLLSDDPARLDVNAIHAYLSRSYWAEGVPLNIVQQAVTNSLCIGVYSPDGAQVGLARIITDSTTFAYLCDVYVLEAHRGKGLSKALMRAIGTHPRLGTLRRFNLVTRDAHGLYTQFGFKPLDEPERYMEKLTPRIYKQA
ncbi:MAG TPA: GNAT family N-acetyltransferase [Opitutaceae bacterium]|nr:GNAT family N-acetyltransferase [Opitutaceae bacterium]